MDDRPDWAEVSDEHDIVIGAGLAAARMAAGLTQAQLAKKIGVSQQFVNRLEVSDRQEVTRQTRDRIQAALSDYN